MFEGHLNTNLQWKPQLQTKKTLKKDLTKRFKNHGCDYIMSLCIERNTKEQSNAPKKQEFKIK